MAKFTLDFGQTWDLLTKDELDQSLQAQEDSRIRALLAGVKVVTPFFNTSQIGAGTQTFSTPAGMIQGGFAWAVMNIGFELALSSPVRIYKGVPSSLTVPAGSGRLVALAANAIVPFQQFSKGQLMLAAGDQLSFYANVASANILSVFMSCIEVPAERVGELLL